MNTETPQPADQYNPKDKITVAPDSGKSEGDKFIERMTGEVEMDEELNQRYAEFQAELMRLKIKDKIKQWFVDFFNQGKKLEGDNKLTLDDVKSLELVTTSEHLLSLKERYGHNYIRPLFRLSRVDFEIFNEKTEGKKEGGGRVIVGGYVNKIPLTKGLRIILTENAPQFEDHELRHSIDPNLANRKGRDKILAEVAAWFGFVLREFIYTEKVNEWVNRQVKISKQDVKTILDAIKEETYYLQSCGGLSYKEFCDAIEQVRFHLAQLTGYYTLDELDRILFNSKSIDDLSRLYVENAKKKLSKLKIR